MIARAGYVALFSAVLPSLLVAWALRLDSILALPAFDAGSVGIALVLAGAALMAGATRDLWVHGGGLPASPYPPGRLVTRGAYGILPHPIYCGAVLVAAGVSLAARSPAGLWIVTPVLALSAVAFVAGFERDATFRRLGALPEPWLRFARDTVAPPSRAERASVYVLVFLPWLVLYEAVEFLGAPPDGVSTYLAWDRSLPVVPWTEGVYAAAYPLALLAPLVAARSADLRRFALDGAWATAIIIPFFLLVPLVAEAKAVPGEGFWQSLMVLERAGDSAATAFPAFHVVWACLAARLYAARWPSMRWALGALVAAIGASCVTTGMHSAIDVVGGFAAYSLVARLDAIWRWLRDAVEGISNSWREVTVGPVRLMSHGIYAGLGGALGFLVAAPLVGSEGLLWLFGLVLASAVGAALWAQFVEGSPQLLRPYGYFGSVFMVIGVAFAAGAFGVDAWRLFAGFGVGACFGQAVGRMRCMVQGCCHGRKAPLFLGVRYLHPLSRVVRLTALGGVPLHPTQLYSALWTMLVGCAMLRLWTLHAPLPFIAGTYFVLVGLGRFVEEHFRGEPQTAIFAGLRLYQWLAIAFVVGGAATTTLGAGPAPAVASLDPRALPLAGLVGLLYYFAYGADIPSSNRRFSRLR